MTSKSISVGYPKASNERWRPIVTDLVFWSVAGATVAVFSRPLGQWWKVPPTALLAGGTTLVVVGAAAWLGLQRMRLTPRRPLKPFGVTNLLLAPALWAVALFHWLPVSTAGNWALAAAGDVAVLLGAWQLRTLRRY